MSPNTPSVLIIGDLTDPHVPPVVSALENRGRTAVVLDAATLETNDYALDAGGLSLPRSEDAVAIPASGDLVGFIRRVAPADWRQSLVSQEREAAVRGAWLAVIVALTRGFRIRWLTGIEQLVFSENKFVQYLTCSNLSIPTPRTVIPSSRSAIPAELGATLVVKALGPSWFTDNEGHGKVVFTTALQRDASELDALPGAPFLVQEKIEAAQHLRVVTVDDKCWICKLEADGLPLDWRSSDDAHSSFTRVEGFSHVREMALVLAQTFRLGYSSQDWIVDRAGKPYFLDLNPAGQWLFLPRGTSDEITGSIAGWLADPPIRPATS